ncbi:sequence-specific DNA binding transcription factor [Tasmannia lanceolata]|uniref:sequence-specific DNA binding transcription factor n=1 Tax=Tasmannia lanceolata TaxID=3420 RepID=UPI004063458B
MEKPPLKNNSSSRKEDDSLTMPLANGCGGRLRRDEWSEGAASSLLEAYESKWILRNRAKLKGHDWEDIALHVSARANSTRSPRTQTQCKNKIESMNKRYRSNVASSDALSWPLFARLDRLLLCSARPPPPPSGIQNVSLNNYGGGLGAKEECDAKKLFNDKLDKEEEEEEKSMIKMKTKKKNKNKRKKWAEEMEDLGVDKSVEWLAEVMIRSEQVRMETMRELETIRAETEAKKAKLELKRTEIIANTQLLITKLLVDKGVDGS